MNDQELNEDLHALLEYLGSEEVYNALLDINFSPVFRKALCDWLGYDPTDEAEDEGESLYGCNCESCREVSP